MHQRDSFTKKDQQMNVRFTLGEIEALDRIAEIEDRDRAYLVGFFTRWGMEQYARIGSLVVLRKKRVAISLHLSTLERRALLRLKLREEADRARTERAEDIEITVKGKKRAAAG